ncbi:MAG: type II toxin-antitoxin system RelE/ParE family toxin [Pseudomonadota bacterium]|jgi:toxin ParE1/3/4|nr:type II toxin-antitoxin system RelE/ParE family toxin [Pseudomonadota bacterium]
MTIAWSARAKDDLIAIFTRISADNIDAATRLRDHVFKAVGMLGTYPSMGSTGRVASTRELALPGTAYLVIYRQNGDGIEILRVLHGARDWP